MKNNFYISTFVTLIILFGSISFSYASSSKCLISSPPRNIKVQQKENSLLITWKKPLRRVDGYRIYRSNTKKTLGKVVATINNSSANSLIDDSVQPNTKYYYTVHSFLTNCLESTNKRQFSKFVKNSQKKDTPVQIVGTILDENNYPIQNATVQLYYVFENSENIYRYGTVKKTTDPEGKFIFSESEFLSHITPKLGIIQKPYSFFLSAIKEEYLDIYIFDIGTTPKILNSGAWIVEGILTRLPEKLHQTKGPYEVNYYPGQEQCVAVAFDKMEYFYPKMVDLFGYQSNASNLKFTFNTSLEQGAGDWLGGAGIQTRCLPWTPHVELSQINEMWNGAIPHEFGHGFVSDFQRLMPYWTNEGLAQYAATKINNGDFACDASKFLKVQDLTGENIPFYNTAACFWKLLENDYPGFIKNTLSYLQQLQAQNIILTYPYETYTKDFLSGVLAKVLVGNYGMTTPDAENYLNNFMLQFDYDPSKP